jgi:hemerythrin
VAFINWTDSLSVGVSEMDNQHKRLIAMINDLSEAMKMGKGKEALGKILSGLIIYTQTHFTAEEKYFEKYNYPLAPSHRREHATFVKKVSEVKTAFDAGKLSVTVETMNFLRDWLKNHIMGTDQKYTQFFNEKGLR